MANTPNKPKEEVKFNPDSANTANTGPQISATTTENNSTVNVPMGAGLTPGSTGSNVKAAESNTQVTPKSATITITKEQLAAFINEAVDKRMGTKIDKPKRVTEHTAVVRYYNGQPVFEMKGLKERLIDGRRVGFINLVLEDGSTVEVEYLPFLNDSERVTVKILDQKATPNVKNHGTVRAINPDPYNNKTWDGGMIDLEVTSYTYEVKVQVITEGEFQGKEFTLSTKALNI